MEYLRLRLRYEHLGAAGRCSWAGTRSCPTCRAPGWLRSCAAGRAAPARCRRLRLRRGVAAGRGYAGTGWGRALAYMRQAFAGSTGAPPSTSTTACSQGGCSRVQTVMGRGRWERCEASRAKRGGLLGGGASGGTPAIAAGAGGAGWGGVEGGGGWGRWEGARARRAKRGAHAGGGAPVTNSAIAKGSGGAG